TEADEVRLAEAEAVAARFGAHLTGLYVNRLPPPPVAFDGGLAMGETIAELELEGRVAGDEAERRIGQRLARLAVPQELRRYDVFDDVAGEVVAQEARWADLFIALRPYAEDGKARSPEIVEHVLFEGGRAILVVPEQQRPADPHFVVVGWNGSREAARAVAEAMPFLRSARHVVIACIGPEAPGATRSAPGADIARHLDRHGVPTTVHDIVGRGRGTGEVLLEEV